MIFKRPWLVFFLMIATLVFTASGITRVWNGIRYYGFLGDLPISVSPLYLVITGGVWGILGAAAAGSLWWGYRRGSRLLISGMVGYSVFFWFEQIFLMTNPLRKTNWPFLAVFNLSAILIVILSFRHPRVRKFFGGRHEQEDQ